MGHQHRCFIGFAWALLTLVTTPVYSQTHAVTIAWDASPDPAVVGYVVYVGTQPGAPAERFEVSGTSFVYPSASDGQPYFFSVAAYSAALRVGSPSEEVMFLGGSRAMTSTTARATAATTDAPPARSNVQEHAAPQTSPINGGSSAQFCPGEDATHCYVPAGSIGPFGEIDALKSIGDGRLIFVEGGSRVIIESPSTNTPSVATAITSETVRFASLVVDPNFTATHFIYIAEADSSTDATARLSVVRYREVDGTLAERAVLIPALPVVGEAIQLAIDGAQHLFVAAPGVVLRYGTDGSVPAGSRAMSPVYAQGVADPASVDWDASTNTLWLTGTQSTGLRRVRLDQEGLDWPRSLEIVSGETGSGVWLTVTTDTRSVLRMSVPSESFEGEPIAAVLNQTELDVAVRTADATTRILRFRQISIR
jgi:hypothetical protein